MKRILIFGNSGSGKSTLAKKLCKTEGLAHLDLDRVAWLATTPPQRQSIEDSKQAIDKFTRANSAWVIEGCYTDLLELAIPKTTEVIFMNLPIEACIANARQRPWEPHKYPSKAAQDANLEMLIDWIKQYSERTDTFSRSAHETLFNHYQGQKIMYTNNAQSAEKTKR